MFFDPLFQGNDSKYDANDVITEHPVIYIILWLDCLLFMQQIIMPSMNSFVKELQRKRYLDVLRDMIFSEIIEGISLHLTLFLSYMYPNILSISHSLL